MRQVPPTPSEKTSARFSYAWAELQSQRLPAFPAARLDTPAALSEETIDGTAVLDASGEAAAELPLTFETLHREFRYQLTAIGAPGPSLYVAEEVRSGCFRIAGDIARSIHAIRTH